MKSSLYALYINNQAGGLIYQRDFTNENKLDANEHLRLASTLSGLALIMRQLAPTKKSSNMERLDADNLVLHSFDTPTGLKFFVTAEPDARDLDRLLRDVYMLYSDAVLKNPFYEADMPIHCERFDTELTKLADAYARGR